MLQDIEYFNEKLGSVEGSGNAAQVLLENVRAMPAPEEEPLFDSEKAELNNREQGKEFVQLPQSEAKELEKDAKVEKTEQPKSAVQTENADSKSDRDSKLEKQSEEGLVEEPSISSNNLENSQSTSNVAEKLDNNSDVTISEGDTSLQSVNDISNEAEKLDDKTGDVDPRLNSEQVDNNLSVDKGVNYAETAKAGISNNNGVDSSTVKDHPSSKEAVASTKDSDPLHSMVPSKESDDIVDYIRPTEELKTKSIDDDDQIKGSNEVEKEGNPNLSSFGQNIENGSTAEDPTAEKVR